MKKYSLYLIVVFIILVAMVASCFIPIRAGRLIPFIEAQVSKDIGAKVHIEKLILRTGPYIKLKAPVMHVLYEDGQKFAQFDSVKFYIPLYSLINNKPSVSSIVAKKLTVRLNSDDQYLDKLIEKNSIRSVEEAPNLYLKSYKLTYCDKADKNTYTLEGQNLLLNKIHKYNNFKLSSVGTLSIGSIKYINFDISLIPNLDLPKKDLKIDFTKYLQPFKELDFHSDIIADLKLYKNKNDILQASGFVNIDNISVLDYAKKNPKSFVYLTLWGDKASIRSNLYTSNEQKIYIEGILNNSKNVSLDLKVKTDEILLSDLHNKLKILSNFSELKSIDSVNGKLIANFNIKGDLNKIKSNGYIKVLNASILADGIKIDNINSDIDLSNNKINIKDATGYVNKALVKAQGYIDKNIDLKFEMNNVDLKYLLPKSFGVQNGVINLVAKLTGTFDSIVHNENLQIDNLKIANKNYELKFDNLLYDSNKNNYAYFKNITCLTPETALIKAPSLKVVLDKDKLEIPLTNVFMPNSKLVLNAKAENMNSKLFSFNVNADGYINSKDVKRFNNASFNYPVKLQVNGNKNIKNINTQILVENTAIFNEPIILNLLAKLDKNDLKIDDLSVLSFSGKLQNDFKSNLKGQRKIAITGSVENIFKPNMKNIRIFIPQQLTVHLFDNIMQFKGDLFVNGDIKKPEIIGQILLYNLTNQALQLNITNAVLDFNKNIIQINSPLIKLLDSTIAVNGNLSTDFSNGLEISNLNVKSKYLNADTFIMYKDSPITDVIPINVIEGKLYSEKVFANIYNSPLYMYGFSSDFYMKNNDLKIKNISTELFNGKLTGEIDYNLKNELFNTKIMSRGVSAEPIFNIISTRSDNISGTMDFDAEINGELTSKQSLSGNIKFIVNNGRMTSLGKLEHLLYAQNVIADNMLRTSLSVVAKAITLKDTGLFKFLRGDVTLKNGVANVNMIQTQGPLMALFIKGIFNPTDNNAQLLVLGRLSDEVVNGLGAFGDFSFNKLLVMLTGEENNTNILPEDYDKIPQLTMKNTKEFRSIINGNIDKTSSVLLFNWISYSEKKLKQKEVPLNNVDIPKFVEELPY